MNQKCSKVFDPNLEREGRCQVYFSSIPRIDRCSFLQCFSNREDSEESVSDTYLAAWNTIPPRRPNFLNAFLAKMTRRISIDRWRKLSAKKRGGGEIILALDELEECVDTHNVETELAKKELTRVLNAFLSSLQETERNVFLCRYWYLDSIQTISEVSGFSQSKVTSMLHRLRGKLRKTLSEEGYV